MCKTLFRTFMSHCYVKYPPPFPEIFLEKIRVLFLTHACSGAIMHLAQESRYGSPVLTPGQSQRVNMEQHRRDAGVFCRDAGAEAGSPYFILSGGASHR